MVEIMLLLLMFLKSKASIELKFDEIRFTFIEQIFKSSLISLKNFTYLPRRSWS